ncbi:uncharacterized protein LOC117111970, partial [Anneissia japonica]|uniref:uncharacterized protein LOC117111970 n=1 Tax=Anneissia japonica TaxID=1529436 RepID=UPI00142566B8
MGPGNATKKKLISNRITVSVTNDQLMQQLQCTWELDNKGLEVKEDSVEDRKARDILATTTTLLDTKHYELGLLWKYDSHPLPCNKPMAESRLASLKRKLDRDDDLKSKYVETVETYISKGHAEPVVGQKGVEGNVWYLPHHPVNHPRKNKVRVVFDCAAKWRGVSLNDNLLKGPEVISNLVGVLLRFRQERIALVADIESMFHQVHVKPSDRDVLRFLWWKDGDTSKSPSEYRMTVHLFGATSSPCCAGYALRRTADDSESKQVDAIGRRAVDVIRNGFYVDDCLTSIRDTSEAIELAHKLRNILQSGVFRLTKWLSSDRQVLDTIPETERAPSVPLSLDQLPTERTLGICWDSENDSFKFEVETKDKPPTRRGILSVTSSIYDPLGFAAPFVLFAKSLLQTVCRRGSEWDEELKAQETEVWNQWTSSIKNLQDIKVPRWLKLESAVSIQLHVFCDASEKGYAAVAYFRTISDNNSIDVSFVMGKAKVTPLKKISIPRLELLAAVLAVKLDGIVRREIAPRFKLTETTFWSDSMIVLGYINNESKRFKTFVANRVTRIRESSQPHQWRHVRSENNPSDEGSRGTLKITKWVTGPDFLSSDDDNWPQTYITDTNIADDPEVKLTVFAHTTNERTENAVLQNLSSKFSSWMMLLRVYAWVLRFVERISNKTRPVQDCSLSVDEIKNSETKILSWLQKTELSHWKTDKRLAKLNPVLMADLLRVGGRINQARVSENMKHPVILPANTDITRLIIRHHHEAMGHGGWASTLNSIRECFWLMKGRTAVKCALRNCVVCKKYHAKPVKQMMANLPAERIADNKPPFTFVGVDYFGPIDVKQGRSR